MDQTRCIFLDHLLSPPRLSVKRAAAALALALAGKGKRTFSWIERRLSKPGPVCSSHIHPSSWEHTFQIEKFLRYIEGKIDEPAVTWEEILEVQRLNEEMGRAVEAAMKANA